MSPVTAMRDFGEIFSRFDADGDGKFSPSELRLLIRSVGEEMELDDVKALVDAVDSDGDGLLDFDDFITLASIGGDYDEELSALREAFEMYAVKGEGRITTESLQRMLGGLGMARDAEECRVMIFRFDLDGDGVLNFEEFIVMMQYKL